MRDTKQSLATVTAVLTVCSAAVIGIIDREEKHS